MFDIVLKEDGSRAKLTEEELSEMKSKIWDAETCEISIDGEFTAASGLISMYVLENGDGKALYKAEKMIKEVLDDWKKERADGIYSFNGFDVYMSR